MLLTIYSTCSHSWEISVLYKMSGALPSVNNQLFI